MVNLKQNLINTFYYENAINSNKRLKMKNIKQIIILIAIMLLGNKGIAQITKTFPKEINSIKMTAPGVAVVGTDDALYGISKDGEELWRNEKLKKIKESQIEILEGSELIYIASFRGSFLINVLSGEIYGDSEPTYGARVVHGTNQVWIIRKYNAIDVYDIETKKKLYRLDNISLPHGLNSSNQTDSQSKDFIGVQPIAFTGKETAILHLGLESLCEYNLVSGKPIWHFNWEPYKVKKPKPKGKGDRASDLKRGYGMMKLDKASNTLYFPFRNILIAIDAKTGKAKWDIKANKIGKAKDIYITDDGIVLLTPKGLQLIDKETGMLKWDKPVKIKGLDGGLLIKEEGNFYVVSKKSIEKVDVANRTSTTLVDKIKFQGGDSFSSLELFDDMIVLSGSQNVVGVNKTSGEILFTTYYKAPGSSIMSIAQNAILTTVAIAATQNSRNLNSRNANANGEYTYHQYTPALRSSGGATTVEAGKNLYISTKFKDNDAKGFGIAKVNKETGKTLKKIVIGDRNPLYVVDENEGVIYYKSDKKTLDIKSLK